MAPGRQPKVTEAFAVKKSTGLKLTVKRKVVIDHIDDEEDENKSKIFVASATPSVESMDNYQAAKNALHMARPANLIARDVEINAVYGWLDDRLGSKSPGSMYISGAPGTGKTAVVLHCIHEWIKNNSSTTSKVDPCWYLVINCMNMLSPSKIYEEIGTTLKISRKVDSSKDNVGNKLLSGKKMLVLVLDEMDQLLNGKGTDLLYTLFDWAKLPGSRLVLIGIANSLDLTVRHLPMLNSPVIQRSPSNASKPNKSKPKKYIPKLIESTDLLEPTLDPMKVINFPPYERQDIENILEARLLEIGNNIFEPAAIKFVATKVAATTGDMRKALNACKLALDSVEKHQRDALKSTADDGFNFSSPKKFCVIREKINVGMVTKVFAPPKDDGPLPLQQMIVLSTLLKINKTAPNSRFPKVDGITTPIPMAQVYEEYRKICATKGFSWIDRSEIVSVCSMLQDRSLVTVVENMSGSGTKTKKFATLSTTNKTGFLFSYNAVEKIVMQCDMKSIVVDM